ncbi:MAG: ATP-dependent Clp protease proteolytic subunit [Candidatus Omnitrophota bacterium]
MKETYIRFMQPVVPQTIDILLRMVDQKIRQKYERINLMISSPGGSVFHGLSAYNFLRGAPIEVYTYNFGSVDSIGVVIYCSGDRRFSVPHARFLIHGVRMNVQGNASFDEYQIHEQLKSVRIDQQNIARVIADTTGKSKDIIEKDMHDRRTLNPNEAKDYGLVHEIKSELFPIDCEFITVEAPNAHSQVVAQAQPPAATGFNRSIDVDIIT